MIILLAVASNLAFWLLIFLIERSERKRSVAKLLYITDWSVGTWGDLVGLTLADSNFARLIESYDYPVLIPLLSVAAGLIASLGSHWVNQRQITEANAGYPDGKMSMSGGVHLLYFFLQSCIVAFIVLDIFTHGYKTNLLGLVGYAIYVAAMIKDWRRGHYIRKA